MKKICGALVISLMITTNVFAKGLCDDKFDEGRNFGWSSGYDAGRLAGIAECMSSNQTGDTSNSRVQELEMRLNECNRKGGWKY